MNSKNESAQLFVIHPETVGHVTRLRYPPDHTAKCLPSYSYSSYAHNMQHTLT